jgi:hypothetical protein
MPDDFGGEERLVDLLQYNLRLYNFGLGWRMAMLLCVDDDTPLWESLLESSVNFHLGNSVPACHRESPGLFSKQARILRHWRDRLRMRLRR